jgi:hypothetical protein
MTTWATLAAQPTVLQREFEHYANYTYPYTFQGWVETLKDRVADPENVGVGQCRDCGLLTFHQGDPLMVFINNHEEDQRYEMCPACYDTRSRVCVECDRRFRTGNMHTVVGGAGGGTRYVCVPCYQVAYTTCRICQATYDARSAENRETHRHRDQMCCESPAMDFTFPFNGDVLRPDTRVSVSLGEHGVLNKATVRKVGGFLMNYALGMGDVNVKDSRARKMFRCGEHVKAMTNETIEKVGREVRRKDGNYSTRLKRYAYKTWGLKLEPEILTHVGNIVSEAHKNREFLIEVTRDLNLTSTEFANSASCWWSNYKESRCALKTNGGIGLRSFEDDDPDKNPNGRVWIMPLKVAPDGGLTPTFRTDTGVFFVFNGYGVLEEKAGVNVVQAMTDAEEVKLITFEADRYYVNNSRGYLMGPKDTIGHIDRLRLPLQQHSALFKQENPAAKKAGPITVEGTFRSAPGFRFVPAEPIAVQQPF